jgi:hypothetical protein
MACDYVHLNPVRAGLMAPEQPLSVYAWSSYSLYLRPARRPGWLRVDRLLGEHGIQEDSAQRRIEFQRRMQDRRKEGGEPAPWAALRRGWHMGAEDFAQRLSGAAGTARAETRAGARSPRHERTIGRAVGEGMVDVQRLE